MLTACDGTCFVEQVALTDIVRFAQEAASGLLHLHSEQVVHRDVASRNLLLNEAWHVKVRRTCGVCFAGLLCCAPRVMTRFPSLLMVLLPCLQVCDFGMSRAVLPSTPSDMLPGAKRQRIGRGGPLRWMAPESLRPKPGQPRYDDLELGCMGTCCVLCPWGHATCSCRGLLTKATLCVHRFSPASDVYMFGITLWEMLVRRLPYWKLPAHEAALRVCTEGFRPSIPKRLRNIASPLVSIMESCWAQAPGDRPAMKVVVQRLHKYRQYLRASSSRSRLTSDGATATVSADGASGE